MEAILATLPHVLSYGVPGMLTVGGIILLYLAYQKTAVKPSHSTPPVPPDHTAPCSDLKHMDQKLDSLKWDLERKIDQVQDVFQESFQLLLTHLNIKNIYPDK